MGLTDFLAGWALGAKTGNRGFDEVLDTGRSIFESKEFQDFVLAMRSHASFALEELAGLVAVDDPAAQPGADLVDYVRGLVAKKDQWIATNIPRPPA